MKRYSLLVLLFSAIIVLSGCLTAQYKVYKFDFKDKTSGTLTITYVNIFSQIYDDEDPDSVLNSDYSELAADYLMGSEVESAFPNAKVVSKKLYEDNYKLNGELVLEFDDISDVNLFQYDKKAPYQFYIPSDEDYFDTDGEKPADYMPVVFWDKKMRSLEVTTTISEMEETDRSLLSTWKANK
ncbi:MAG: hypothetical protein JXL97_10485 [Bacteroidales bacterium]|nr:hypothetical protein [Bacteroidales bacterium]